MRKTEKRVVILVPLIKSIIYNGCVTLLIQETSVQYKVELLTSK